jgi:hypothetical protein
MVACAGTFTATGEADILGVGKLGVRRHILTGFSMSIEKMGFLMVWSFLSAMWVSYFHFELAMTINFKCQETSPDPISHNFQLPIAVIIQITRRKRGRRVGHPESGLSRSATTTNRSDS